MNWNAEWVEAYLRDGEPRSQRVLCFWQAKLHLVPEQPLNDVVREHGDFVCMGGLCYRVGEREFLEGRHAEGVVHGGHDRVADSRLKGSSDVMQVDGASPGHEKIGSHEPHCVNPVPLQESISEARWTFSVPYQVILIRFDQYAVVPRACFEARYIDQLHFTRRRHRQ